VKGVAAEFLIFVILLVIVLSGKRSALLRLLSVALAAGDVFLAIHGIH
jgi:hypothetical protein